MKKISEILSFLVEKLRYPHLIVGSYLAVILAGAAILEMPMSVNGEQLEFTQALFTATSATCVTGLTVVDTGARFSFFGQFVILCLIQVGGLGFMTISTFFLALIGKKISLRFNLAAQEAISQSPIQGFQTTLKYIFFLVVCFEAAGALFLMPVFLKDYPVSQALWLSVFHSISAFCNAGFSLFPDSLNRYCGNVLLNIVIMTLIVCGGMGFLVLVEIRKNISSFIRKPKIDIFSLHTKIIVFMTVFLIVIGFLLIFGFESGRALRSMPLKEKVLTSLFQSITPRTAGFNTITTNTLSEPTLIVMMLLMFIGGASGSTAGGIKIGTAVAVLCFVYSIFTNKSDTMVFKRKIPQAIISKSIAISFVSLTAIALCVIFLAGSFPSSLIQLGGKGPFMLKIFECFSAFGTVGLSLGVTPLLDATGRLIIIFLMFLGRIGPLLLGMTLLARRERLNFEYPEENIMI